MSEDFDFDDVLMWREQRIRIESLGGDGASAARRSSAALPAALVSLAEHSERSNCVGREDLAVVCSDAVARKLTDRMWQRARELAVQGHLAFPLPGDVTRLGRELSTRAVIEVLGAVVAAHLEYDDARAAKKGFSFEGSLFAQLLELARIALSRRGPGPVRIARRVTGVRIAKGVCLDYATAVRTLFYALKRATGAPSDAFVVEVAGEAFGMHYDLHAWNWLIDCNDASIVAFDATPGPGGRRGLAIDLERYCNVSAFLATAVVGAMKWKGYDPRNVAELLAASIDPETDRGQALLFGIADHLAVSPGIRDRIAAHLAARDFERLLPDWRERLARRTARLGSIGRRMFTASDDDVLLDQLRLATSDRGGGSPSGDHAVRS